MPYQIIISDVADAQFRRWSARDRATLLAAIIARLRDRPDLLTRATKRLRPNPTADYELRVGDLRALYNVTADRVLVEVVGRKVGNELIVEGKVFLEHRDDSRKPDDPAGPDADGLGHDPA